MEEEEEVEVAAADTPSEEENDDPVEKQLRELGFSEEVTPAAEHAKASSPVALEAADGGLEKYLKLVDTSGLALALKNSDAQLEKQDARLATVEKLIDSFPNDYVTAQEVRENTERMDYLSKKMKKVLETAERSQKVDQIKITGEIKTVSASLANLESRMTRLEADHRSVAEQFRDMRGALAEKASAEDLRAVRLRVERSAQVSELRELRTVVDRCARKDDIDRVQVALQQVKGNDARLDALSEKFMLQFDNLKSSLSTFATAEHAERVEDKALEAMDRVEQVRSGVNLISSQLDTFAEQMDTLHQAMQQRASLEDLAREGGKLQSGLMEQLETLRSALARSVDRVDAIGDTVGVNVRGVERCEAELGQVRTQLENCMSATDWEQIEAELVEAFASKEQVASTVEPIVNKLNQVVNKLIDMDKLLSSKSDAETSLENREHIQDLYRILRGSSAGGAEQAAPPPTDKRPGTGNSAGSGRRSSAADLRAVQAQVSEQAHALARIEAVLSAQGGADAGGLRDAVLQQGAQIEALMAEMAEIRGLILQRNGNGGQGDLLAGRPTRLADGDMVPRRPSNGGTRPARVAPTSSDKQRWETAEKERWLSETRAAAPTSTASTAATSETGGTNAGTLPKLG